MLKRLQLNLPNVDTLYTHILRLHDTGIIADDVFLPLVSFAQGNRDYSRFLSTTLAAPEITETGVSGHKDSLQLPEDCYHVGYTAFIRILAAKSGPDTVLKCAPTVGISNLSDKPPEGGINAAAEALCELNWRRLESHIGRRLFARLILSTSLFLELKPNCYLQVSGYRVDLAIGARWGRGRAATDLPPAVRLQPKQIFYYNTQRRQTRMYHLSLKDVKTPRDFLSLAFPKTMPLSSKRVPKRLNQMYDICQQILGNFARVSLFPFLEKWCPLDSSESHDTANMISFCRNVSHELLPHCVFGSSENWTLLREKYRYYFHMPRRFRPKLSQMTEGFRITDIDWLFTSPNGHKKSLGDMQKAQELFDEFMLWLFDTFLAQLLKSFFYFTDSMATDQVIYRHELWQKLTAGTVQDLTSTQFIQKADSTAPSELGVSRFRLVPKKVGFRPIVSLGRPVMEEKRSSKYPASINKRLSRLHKVLYQEWRLANSNVCGLDSVSELKQVLDGFRAKMKVSQKNPMSFKFVKIDVTAAFDTIPASKVQQLATKLLSCDYSLGKHILTVPMDSHNTLRYLHSSRASTGKTEPLLDTFKRVSRRGIIIDEGKSDALSGDSLKRLLRAHLFQNDVLIDGATYRQKRGVPQGSVLSSLFCAMVYEHMIATHLSTTVQRQDTILVRYVDDFLLITTDTPTAIRFLNKTLAGIPEFGITVNKAKCLVNFPVVISGSKIPQLSKGMTFPFLGMHIETSQLHVHKRYTQSVPFLWVEQSTSLSQVSQRALEYFSSRFPRALIVGKIPVGVVTRNVAAFNRFVFIRAAKTYSRFRHLSRDRLEHHLLKLASRMISISLSIVEKNVQVGVRRNRLEKLLVEVFSGVLWPSFDHKMEREEVK